MNTAEVPLPPIEPLEPIVPEPARWSALAQRRLLTAQIVGSALAALGALLFFSALPLGLEDLLVMYAGLGLMPIGAGIAYLAAKTRAAAPDQAYLPQSAQTPRNLFIVIWLMGVFAPVVLHAQSSGELKTQGLVSLAVSSAFVLSGGRWAFRWFANKLHAEWPTGRMAAPLAVPLSWPCNWAVNWAGLLGVLAGVLAGAIEIGILWLVATVLEPVLAPRLSSAVETSDLVYEALTDPLTLIGIFVAVAVIAPAIEEAAKGLGLRLLRRQIQRPSDGLVLGMLIGLGFGVMESGLYLSSLNGWLIGGWLRLSTLMLHGIATSVVGVAYARSLISGQGRQVVAGYGRAVLLHGLWNASAIGIGYGISDASSWWLSIICLCILIFLITRMIPRAVLAGIQTVIQEGYQQATANLPPEWSPSDYGIGWRLMGSRPRWGVRVVPEAPLEVVDMPLPGDFSPGNDAAPDKSG